MAKSSITPADLADAFARVRTLQSEVERRERAIGRKAQQLARGLAEHMRAGDYIYRQTIGIHAFDVNGEVCLASAYLDEERGEYRYRYAVLCGGETAKRALRTAPLDPGDSDEPGPGRRVALAAYADHLDFIERLAGYIAAVAREFGVRSKQTDSAESRIQDARQQMSSLSKRSKAAARIQQQLPEIAPRTP